MTQTTPIRALLGFKKDSAQDVLARANAVLGGVFTDKDDYPNAPIDQATLTQPMHYRPALLPGTGMHPRPLATSAVIYGFYDCLELKTRTPLSMSS